MEVKSLANTIIIPQELVDNEYVKYIKSQVKLKIFDEVKDILFSNKYFIIKAVVKESNQVDFNKANLYIKGDLIIEELTLENICKILKLIE